MNHPFVAQCVMSALLVSNLAMPVAALAADVSDNNAFMAISPVSLRGAQLVPSDKVLAINYVNTQLANYNLTFPQYLSLEPSMQRQILELPGRTTYVSREMRRKLSDFRVSVPTDVLARVTAGQSLSETLMERYAVRLPENIELSASSLPAGCERVLIGNKYALIESASHKVIDVVQL